MMRYLKKFTRIMKIYYSPLEAAIRWSGLFQFESRILASTGNKKIPAPDDFPQWPMLRLYTERIYDAIYNGELPFGLNGINCEDPSFIDHPNLTVRHVNLKTWMAHYYPSEKPLFLFDAIERKLHDGIQIETFQTLLVDRDALKLQLKNCSIICQSLYKENKLFKKQLNTILDRHSTISHRAEKTYLNIIGGLIELSLAHSPSGKPYSAFKTQGALISALLAHFPGRLGITERTLEAKFASARRTLSS